MKMNESTRLRFGAFELNLKTGELYSLGEDSDGKKVLFQEQPFRVLRFLIDCDGEIATSEEIKRRLWPNDTIVDFDHSINVAIATLRRVFGESAVECRYIETIPRRGYRLIGPVERVEPLGDLPKTSQKTVKLKMLRIQDLSARKSPIFVSSRSLAEVAWEWSIGRRISS